jgi:hypothetical protein
MRGGTPLLKRATPSEGESQIADAATVESSPQPLKRQQLTTPWHVLGAVLKTHAFVRREVMLRMDIKLALRLRAVSSDFYAAFDLPQMIRKGLRELRRLYPLPKDEKDDAVLAVADDEHYKRMAGGSIRWRQAMSAAAAIIGLSSATQHAHMQMCGYGLSSTLNFSTFSSSSPLPFIRVLRAVMWKCRGFDTRLNAMCGDQPLAKANTRERLFLPSTTAHTRSSYNINLAVSAEHLMSIAPAIRLFCAAAPGAVSTVVVGVMNRPQSSDWIADMAGVADCLRIVIDNPVVKNEMTGSDLMDLIISLIRGSKESRWTLPRIGRMFLRVHFVFRPPITIGEQEKHRIMALSAFGGAHRVYTQVKYKQNPNNVDQVDVVLSPEGAPAARVGNKAFFERLPQDCL